MKIFTDFHHNSLMRSLVMLFQDRLGIDVYRPIGMDWWTHGYWAINDLEPTARQFLDPGSQPTDGTPSLNNGPLEHSTGVYRIWDPGYESTHSACTLGWFFDNDWDFVLCSIPQHLDIYAKLARLKHCPLIFQIGNNWHIPSDTNCLISTTPTIFNDRICYYRQEFDTQIFSYTPNPQVIHRRAHSYVNCIMEQGSAWVDYMNLKNRLTVINGIYVASYGGQCPDGNATGPRALAEGMRDAMFGIHLKPQGDGYGHVIHNWFSVGRPVIYRASHYRTQLAEELFTPENSFDMDKLGFVPTCLAVAKVADDLEAWQAMCEASAQQFRSVVDFSQDATNVSRWLERIS